MRVPTVVMGIFHSTPDFAWMDGAILRPDASTTAQTGPVVAVLRLAVYGAAGQDKRAMPCHVMSCHVRSLCRRGPYGPDGWGPWIRFGRMDGLDGWVDCMG